MTRSLVIAVLMLSGAGAWISGELLKQHDDVWNTAAPSPGLWGRVCRAGGQLGLDCSTIGGNPWSEIPVAVPLPSSDWRIDFHRVVVPVAFLGLAYFTFFGVWYLLVGRPRPGDPRLCRIPQWLARCGASFSAFYVGIMVMGLAPRCLACGAVHFVNFLLALLIERLFRPVVEHKAPVIAAAGPRAPTTAQAVRAIAIVLAVVGGLWLYRREYIALGKGLDRLRPYRRVVSDLQADPEFLLREFLAQPVQVLDARDQEESFGGPELVVFTDYSCPACFCARREVEDLIEKAFAGALRITTRHYPLCRECNIHVSRTIHADACEAAYAAEAARRVGGAAAFEQMHRLLFANRKNLVRERFVRLATQVGLDPQEFLRELDGEAVRRAVADDTALASRLGVDGTPAMFLNGRRVPQLCRTPVFWKTMADRFSRGSPAPAVATATESAEAGS